MTKLSAAFKEDINELEDYSGEYATADRVLIFDESAQELKLLPTSRLGGSDSLTAALLLGAGTSASPVAITEANKNAIGIWYTTSATTGDTRAIYARLTFTNAGGGEALRAYGTVANAETADAVAVGGTVNGAHISLSASGANARISGAGHALRATLGLGAATAVGGTIDVAQLDTDIASDATIPSYTAFISLDNVGSKKLDYILRATNMDTSNCFVAAGTGANSAAVSTGGVASKVLKVRVNGTDYWLPLFSSNA